MRNNAPRQAEVVVVGGGVIGTAITYYLAKYGVDVCLVERNDIAAGTSGAAASGVALQTKPPGPKQNLARESVTLFRGLEDELEADVEFTNEGGMLVAETEEQFDLIKSKAAKAAKAGLAIEVLTSVETLARQPHLTPQIVGATFCADDSTVNPYLLAFAYTRAALRLGASAATATEVIGLQTQADQITAVVTKAGQILTETVVNAAGPWAPELAQLAGVRLPVKPRKGELLVTAPGPPLLHGTVISAGYLLSKEVPQGGDEGAMTVGLWAGQTRRGNLLIGSTREFAGYDRGSTYPGMQALLQQTVRLIPAAARRHVLRSYAGLRPSTPDGLPILGPAPELPGFIFANGHEGDGIALSPITGKRIADLLTGRITEADLAPFSPQRFVEPT